MKNTLHRTTHAVRGTAMAFAFAAAGIAQADPDVRIETVAGDFTISLTPGAAPNTVANFLNYVSRGDYTDMFFHRSEPDFVLQGGGFAWPEGELNVQDIPADAPVVNEFNVTNARGTVAMAKLGGDPNSATNQWFVNLAANGGNLDGQNGGFTVFGTVDAAGMQVVDAISQLERVNAGGAFNALPVVNFQGNQVLRDNVVLVLRAFELPSNDVAPGAAILPSGRAVGVNSPATAFATLLNASDVSVERCRFAPATDVPATFSYRQTNPDTNVAIGPADPLIDIAAGAAATFVFSLTPTAAFPSTAISFDFDCGTTPSALPINGVNTFELAATTNPAADVIALAATVIDANGNGGGIVDVPASIGSGAFSVATVNLGSAEAITVTADTGGADLPVALFVCPTNAITGVCEEDPAPTLTAQMGSSQAATFGIFVQGSGDVPFDPAGNRAFVRFRAANGALRGSTSVAIRTTSE